MSRVLLGLGGAAAVAVIWTGGWFAGKSFIVEPEADRQVEQLRSGDFFFSYDEREIGGFPFGYDIAYRGVAISTGDGWRWTAPAMSVATGVADAGAFVLTPSDESKLTLDAPLTGGAPDDAPLVMNIASEALTATLAQENFEISAKSILAEQAPGEGMVQGALVSFADLASDGSVAPDGSALDMTLTASSSRIAYRFSVDGGVVESRSDTTMSDVEIKGAIDNLNAEDLADFLAKNGRAEFVMKIGAYEGAGGVTGGPSSPPFDYSGSGAASSAELSVIDGRARYAASNGAMSGTFETGPPAPFPGGAVRLGDASVLLEMPLKKADAPQPYALSMRFDGFEMGDVVWDAFDPGAKIERTAINLNMDFGGVMTVQFDLGGNSFGSSPVDVETLEIRDVSIDGLGVSALANGELEVAGDARQPEGTVHVEVSGAFALMDRMTEAGLLPPGQGDFFKAIAMGFARVGEGGPDHLVADIAAADGGVSINGKPLQ